MSDNPNVEQRTPEPPVVLAEVATQLLEEARSSDAGHAALTLTPAEGGALKQTLVAATAGGRIAPEHWNGPASLLVLTGEATIDGDGSSTSVGEGCWVPMLHGEVGIQASEDVVALLTVVPNPTD